MKNQLSQEVISLLEDHGIEITESIIKQWTEETPKKDTIKTPDFNAVLKKEKIKETV